MADGGVKECRGSCEVSFTNRTTVGRESDKVLAELFDFFVGGSIMFDILGLANNKKKSEWFKRFVSFQAGKGRLTVNSDSEMVGKF